MIGTVSHGTLQPRDLIPAFISALEDVCPDSHLSVTSRWEDVIRRAADLGWDEIDPEDADYLLDDLFNALDAAAPEGAYFGAIEGDGSDFGFWPVEGEEP